MLLLVAFAYSVWYFSPAGVQSRGMRAARRHINTTLAPLVRADERFKDVQLGVYTGEDGAVWVHGQVATWDDARALRATVAHSKPSTAVYWGGLMVAESLERDAPEASLTERVTRP